eukprot:scaffold89974_cov36-Tisochrysis_lutea.AAC.1
MGRVDARKRPSSGESPGGSRFPFPLSSLSFLYSMGERRRRGSINEGALSPPSCSLREKGEGRERGAAAPSSDPTSLLSGSPQFRRARHGG